MSSCDRLAEHFSLRSTMSCWQFGSRQSPSHPAMSRILEADAGAPLQDPVVSEIQQALRLTSCEDVLSLLVMHGDDSCTVLQIIFDHSKLNGIQVLQLLQKRSEEMMDIFFAEPQCHYWKPNKHMMLYRKGPQVPRVPGLSSMQEVFGAHIFQAPYPSLTVRQIYKEIFRLFASDFFMCIDLSHLFSGEPCMLRISYYWNRDFDEQWDEMIALKKSKDMVLCNWRNHLRKQAKWASHLPQLSADFLPLYGNNRPLETSEVTFPISAVAFSLFADKHGCFFSVYPGTSEPQSASELQSEYGRFQKFKDTFQLEPPHLRVRPAGSDAKLAAL